MPQARKCRATRLQLADDPEDVLIDTDSDWEGAKRKRDKIRRELAQKGHVFEVTCGNLKPAGRYDAQRFGIWVRRLPN